MYWEKKEGTRLPIKSWCRNIESPAMEQAVNLADHSEMFSHIAIMPDCHMGYGMPIGGVAACENSIIPNAVGVDIGCGMAAVETDLSLSALSDGNAVRTLLDKVKRLVPAGEGRHHGSEQNWSGFAKYRDSVRSKPRWMTDKVWSLAKMNLGTLGGGNHFIEIQKDENNKIWLMLHSGSRNLGYRIAGHYHDRAQPYRPGDLAYLPAEEKAGREYIRDMNFALEYAAENRRRMMDAFKSVMSETFPRIVFKREVNIHHNYAAREKHFGREVWVHRKGATSAREGEMGIIPGSMGTPSYIVRGLGNPDSFMSCSHGAGRVMSRRKACRELSVRECDKAMGDVVYDSWQKQRRTNLPDLSEAPQAYKDIEEVIGAELDLIVPVVRLMPLGVIKG